MRSRLANLSLSGTDLRIGQDLSKKLEIREEELRERGVPVFESCLKNVEDQAKEMIKAISQHEDAQKDNTDESQKQAQARYHMYLSDRKEKLLGEVMEIQKMGKLFKEDEEQ